MVVRSRFRASHGAGTGDEGLHLADGLLPADEDGVGDDRVADVQFLDQRQRGDPLDVVVVQPVAALTRSPSSWACSTAIATFLSSKVASASVVASAYCPVWISTA